MVITYHGLQFFKIQYGDVVLAFDPPSKDSSHKSARFGADIVMTSVRHPDFNGGELLSGSNKTPFIITGPGEYEVSEVFIKGFGGETSYGEEKRINTIYYLTLEGINILFLGAQGNPELAMHVYEAIDNVDILFVPIGDNGTLNAVEAHKLGVKLEARVIIPMNYTSSTLDLFLKEEGVEKKKTLDKLTIKPKDIAGMVGEIVVLSPEK